MVRPVLAPNGAHAAVSIHTGKWRIHSKPAMRTSATDPLTVEALKITAELDANQASETATLCPRRQLDLPLTLHDRRPCPRASPARPQ